MQAGKAGVYWWPSPLPRPCLLHGPPPSPVLHRAPPFHIHQHAPALDLLAVRRLVRLLHVLLVLVLNKGVAPRLACRPGPAGRAVYFSKQPAMLPASASPNGRHAEDYAPALHVCVPPAEPWVAQTSPGGRAASPGGGLCTCGGPHPTGGVGDQPDALDGPELLELAPQLLVRYVVAQAGHNDGLVRVTL